MLPNLTFSCLVSCVIMCENAVVFCPWLLKSIAYKDPENVEVFIICRLTTKSWQKSQAGPASSECTFCDKTLQNVYASNEHFTGGCYKVSYRYEMLGAKTRKRNSESVLSQFLAPLGLSKPSKILRLQWYKNLFVSPPKSKMKIQTTGVKYNCLRLY